MGTTSETTRRRVVLLTVAWFVAAVGFVSADTTRWVPVVASTDGLNGTRWTTDLWIHNLAVDEPITVLAALFTSADGEMVGEVAIECPPVDPVAVSDVVSSLFAQDGVGAMRLRSAHRFEARSRTFNDGGGAGTFGQGIPALDAAEDSAPFGALVGLSHNESSRTNIGILNTNEFAVEDVMLFVFGDDNEIVGFGHDISLAAHGWTQVSLANLLAKRNLVINDGWIVIANGAAGAAREHDWSGVAGLPEAAARLAKSIRDFGIPGAGLIFYASRVDNVSGDAVFLQPFMNYRYEVEPDDVEVQFSSDAEGGMSIYAVEHSNVSGDTSTVVTQADSWHSEVSTPRNQMLCLEAIGHASGASGSLTACVSYDERSACRTCSGESDELCQVETCLFVY